MSVIHRGSTEQNTWSIDDQLYDTLISSPTGSILRVINKKGRGINLTQADVTLIWESKGYLSSKNGHLVKIVRFPWHPLEM